MASDRLTDDAFMLSTRENFSRAFTEYGVVLGVGKRSDEVEATLDALKDLGRNGESLGFDAIVAVRLFRPSGAPNSDRVMAYGTAIKWVLH